MTCKNLIKLGLILVLTIVFAQFFTPAFPFRADSQKKSRDLKFEFDIDSDGSIFTTTRTHTPILTAIPLDFRQFIDLSKLPVPVISVKHQICLGLTAFYENQKKTDVFFKEGPVAIDLFDSDMKAVRLKSGDAQNNLTNCFSNSVEIINFLPVSLEEKHPEIFRENCKPGEIKCHLTGKAYLLWRVSLLNRPISLIAIYFLSFILSTLFSIFIFKTSLRFILENDTNKKELK